MATATLEAEADTGVMTDVSDHVLEFKKRMLAWPNPVEFVNNMYGCHPDGGGNEYFKEVFSDLNTLTIDERRYDNNGKNK